METKNKKRLKPLPERLRIATMQKDVAQPGFKPGTTGLAGRLSIRLSYWATEEKRPW